MGTIKRFVSGLAFLLTAVGFFALTQLYEKTENRKAKDVLDQIQVIIKDKHLTDNNVRFIKDYLQDHANAVYFLLLDPVGKRGVGIVNVENFSHGAAYIDAVIQQKSMLQAFDMLKNTTTSPNEHINLVQDYWVEQSLQVKYAYLNPVHYLQWGFRGPIVTWGFYLWYLLGGVLSVIYFVTRTPREYIRLEQAPSASLQEEEENMKFLQARAQEQLAQEESLDEAAQEVATDMIYDESDEDDDTKVDDIPAQVWIRLLEEPDLKDWETKGQFYVREDKKGLHAIGFPWASSIITRKEVVFDEFIFEVEARVLTGIEGFSLLFRIGGFHLTWVLGGWNNTKSMVLGYDDTVTYHQIFHKKWYHIRVELEDNEVIGYVDGRTAWTLPKSDIIHDSPDVGFQKGLGIGVFKTTVKFRNVRVLKV